MLFKKIVAIILMAGFIILQPIYIKTPMAREKFRILIKNGSKIITSYYYEENGMLYYYKYGTYVGIRKSSVISVDPVQEETYGETVQIDSKFKEKQSQYEARRKKAAYDNISDCEKKKRMAEKNVRIYCGNLEGIRRNIGKTPVKAESMPYIIKNRRSCDYYRDLLEDYKKKCP